MCGIFGVAANENSKLTGSQVRDLVGKLLALSESRGKEASGLAFLDRAIIRFHRRSAIGSVMFRSKECRGLFESVSSGGLKSPIDHPAAIIGHARLVTNGRLQDRTNNQPVSAGGMVGVHNGIIVNDGDLWRKFPDLKRESQVDTEVLFRLIRKFLQETGSLSGGVRRAFGEIQGVANVAVFFEDYNQLLLATNNGSLYLFRNDAGTVAFFASEEYFVQKCRQDLRLDRLLGDGKLIHVLPGTACFIDVCSLEMQTFSLDADAQGGLVREAQCKARRQEEVIHQDKEESELTILASPIGSKAPDWFLKEYDRVTEAVGAIRRCTRCVLPETVPFLAFDENGVCSDCRDYTPFVYKGAEALAEAVAPYRRDDGKPDCLMPLSGGRDSCYSLHYARNVLGMHPIAYTYDWGMVTDLARRNQMRMCGKLGIEHVLVSANLAWKRRNIRKNVEVWLKKPDMGIIPLFMAGDKQFFHYADRIRRQNDIHVTMFSMNWLEDTDFKSGYCGINRGARADYPGSKSDTSMIGYYLKAFLRNPGYLNASLLDTMWAYYIYYLSPVHSSYITFDHYIPWNEENMISTLRGIYDWELSPDTETTWRIGDGTVAFYNYIYFTVGGFTENDTFRSNQVRAGMLTRNEALALTNSDNRQRYESMAWYCETIGVDLERSIRIINGMPKRYPC